MLENAIARERALENSHWRVLTGSFISYGFDAVDFMVLALALPALISDWQLSLGEAGLLGTAGMIGVGLSSVAVGWYSDNFGRRRALIGSVAVFAVLTMAVAFARNWWDVLALRLLAGLGLGGVWGVVSAYVNETWPAKSRSRATAFVLSAWPIGIIGAALLARLVLPQYGWRALFLSGGLALIAALYVYWFVPESQAWQHQRNERRAAGRATHVSVTEIFVHGRWRRTLLGTLVAACALTAYWGTTTWLPTYLVREHGLEPAQMTNFLIIMSLGMFLGYQIFGYVADQIGRKKTLLLCFIGASGLLPLYAVVRDLGVLLWLGPAVAAFFAYLGLFGSYFAALFPAHIRSTGAGFCFNVGRGISAFAPYALGELAARWGLSISIALCAVGYLLAALLMVFMPDIESGDER